MRAIASFAFLLQICGTVWATDYERILEIDGVKYGATNLVGISLEAFLTEAGQRISWNDSKKIALELQMAVPVLLTNPAPQVVSNVLVSVYRSKLRERLTAALAQHFVRSFGPVPFHYDSNVVEEVLGKGERFDFDYGKMLQAFQAAKTKADMIEASLEFSRRWPQYGSKDKQDSARKSGEFYFRFRGTRALELLLFVRNFRGSYEPPCTPAGWTKRENEKGRVVLGNFNYHMRTVVCPQLATNYAAAYADKMAPYNVFFCLVEPTANTNYLERMIDKLAMENGETTEEDSKFLSDTAKLVGTRVKVLQERLDGDELNQLFGQQPSPDAHTCHVLQKSNEVRRVDEMLENYVSEDDSAEGQRHNGRPLNSETNLYLMFIWGQDQQAKRQMAQNPPKTAGPFGWFIEEQYYGEKYREFKKRIAYVDDTICPSDKEVTDTIRGTRVENIFYNYEPEKLKPVR